MTYLPPVKSPAVVEPRLLDLHSAWHSHCESMFPRIITPIDGYTRMQWLLDEPYQANPFWANAVNVTATDNNLIKTAGGAGGNAGAVSTTKFTGDGFCEFTTSENNKRKTAGLGVGDANTSPSNINYSLQLDFTGSVQVHELGAVRGTFGTYVAGDVFRVARVSGTVTYYKNNTLLYTSGVASGGALSVDTSLFDVGATLNAVSIQAEPSPFWTSVVHVTATGHSLTKTTVPGWDSGAVSAATFAGDGYCEFTTAENNTAKMAGLGVGDASQSYNDIEYAVYMMLDGAVDVWESGNPRGPFGTYVAGDIFRVARINGTVTYYKNGVLFYTSLVPSSGTMCVDTSLYSTGATVNAVLIYGSLGFWTTLVNVTAVGNNLTKTGGAVNTWDAGAASRATISGNGYCEFTTAEANTAKMAGLNASDTSPSYEDVDYAILLQTNGVVQLYESGNYLGNFGTHVANDVFRVQRIGSTVTYYKNGTLLYTSLVPSSGSLCLDTSLYSSGATLNAALLHGSWVNTGTLGSAYDFSREPSSPYPPYYGPTGTFTSISAPADGANVIYAASGAVRLVTTDNSVKTGLGNGSCSTSAWVRIVASSPWGRIIEKKWLDDNSWSPPFTGGIMMTIDGGGQGIHSYVTYGTNTSQNFNAGVTLNFNQWYLVSETFDATTGTFRLYVNGVLRTTAGPYGATNLAWGAGRWETMKSGNPSGEDLKGSVFDIRVEMGVVRDAAYYLAMYNALAVRGPMDASLHAIVPTLDTGTVIDTVSKIAGVGSLLYDGVTKRCVEIAAPQWGAEEWTVEMWVRWTALCSLFASGSQAILRCGSPFTQTNNTNVPGPNIVLNDNAKNGAYPTGAILFNVGVRSTNYAAVTDTAVITPNGAWHHIALQRENPTPTSSRLALYVDGVMVKAVGIADPGYVTLQAPWMQLGWDIPWTGSYWYTTSFAGNIDEVRITTGRKRYSGNFTPVQAAFVDEAVPPNPILGEVRISSLGDFYDCVNDGANLWRRLVTL